VGCWSLDLDKALKARDFDASRPSELKVGVWLDVLRIVAKHGQPNASEEDALDWLGREMVRGYCDGLVGKSLFLLLRMMGPKRAMLRIAANYATADGVTRVTASARGDLAVDLEFNSAFGVPGFIRGVLFESLIQMNASQPSVSFSSLPSGVVLFSTSWAQTPASATQKTQR